MVGVMVMSEMDVCGVLVIGLGSIDDIVAYLWIVFYVVPVVTVTGPWWIRGGVEIYLGIWGSHGRRDYPCCPGCDYDLRMLEERRCPECGFDFSGMAEEDLVGLKSSAAYFKDGIKKFGLTLMVAVVWYVAILIWLDWGLD